MSISRTTFRFKPVFLLPLKRYLGLIWKRLFRAPPAKSVITRRPVKTALSKDEAEAEFLATWPDDRLAVVQALWGEGFVYPGVFSCISEILLHMDLSDKNSVLLMGAGLGGPGKLIVDSAGAWVTGYEGEKELAERGKVHTKKTGMTKRAPVSYCNWDNLKLKPKSIDAAILLPNSLGQARKDAVIEPIVSSLRANGELWYIDFVLPNAETSGEALTAWSQTESILPRLWPPEGINALLNKFDLSVQAPKDVTELHRNRIFKELLTFLTHTNKKALIDIADGLFDELNKISKQINAIDSGELKIYQFYAFKPPN